MGFAFTSSVTERWQSLVTEGNLCGRYCSAVQGNSGTWQAPGSDSTGTPHSPGNVLHCLPQTPGCSGAVPSGMCPGQPALCQVLAGATQCQHWEGAAAPQPVLSCSRDTPGPASGPAAAPGTPAPPLTWNPCAWGWSPVPAILEFLPGQLSPAVLCWTLRQLRPMGLCHSHPPHLREEALNLPQPPLPSAPQLDVLEALPHPLLLAGLLEQMVLQLLPAKALQRDHVLGQLS